MSALMGPRPIRLRPHVRGVWELPQSLASVQPNPAPAPHAPPAPPPLYPWRRSGVCSSCSWLSQVLQPPWELGSASLAQHLTPVGAILRRQGKPVVPQGQSTEVRDAGRKLGAGLLGGQLFFQAVPSLTSPWPSSSVHGLG